MDLPTNGLITIKPRLLCSENRTNEELKALDVQQSEVSKRMLSVKGDGGSPGTANAFEGIVYVVLRVEDGRPRTY